ncbi:MAG: 1-deoxy-D-xylulose-5-phosphate synthase [Bacilli bacterium]|nr:1-deoxy-D-xylulose-5-phosphate synthase [Bacilli bacterium]
MSRYELKFNLDLFKTPNYIKKISKKDLPLLAEDFRYVILQAVSKNGGHLSSNLGIVELTISLHRVFNLPEDKILFDVGHQSYTHKLLTGRSLENLRQKDGVSGFIKINESKFDCFEAGHSSTSLSAAQGMAISRDLNKDKYNVIAVIGDASISSGMAFEALNDIGRRNNKVIIILNDNDMAISKTSGALSMFLDNSASSLSPENYFNSLGLAYIGPVDGHNFDDLEEALQKAKNAEKSVIVHVNTIKGKGYKPAEEDYKGIYHGVNPFDIDMSFLDENKNTWSKYYADLTSKFMENNKDIVCICPAMITGSELNDTFEKFHDRCFDVGIAEEHAITLASGFGLNGKHPVISIYSTFLQRAIDQVNHDLCRMSISSTILVDHCGLIGNDGETHQGIYDEGYLVSTPNTIVAMASNKEEAKQLYELSLQSKLPFFIRFPREICEDFVINDLVKIEIGTAKMIRSNNSKNLLISIGPMIHKISKIVEKDNIDLDILNCIFIKPLGEENLKSILKYKNIFIYNPYSTQYGLVNTIKGFLINNNYNGIVHTFCIPDSYIKQSSISEQLEDLCLSPDQLAAKIKFIID